MKIGRNEPCPCGSGKKYKKCCIGLDSELRKIPNDSDKSVYEILPLVKLLDVPTNLTPTKFGEGNTQVLYSNDYLEFSDDFKKRSQLNTERMEKIIEKKDDVIRTIRNMKFFDSIKGRKERVKDFFEMSFFHPYHLFGNQHQSWFDGYYDIISELNFCDKKGDILLWRCMSKSEYDDLSKGVKSPSWTPQFTSTRTFKYSHIMINPKEESYIVGCVFDYKDIICEVDYGNKQYSEFEVLVRKGSIPKSIDVCSTWGINDMKKMWGDDIEDYLPIEPEWINNGYSCLDYVNYISNQKIKDNSLTDVFEYQESDWDKSFVENVVKISKKVCEKFPMIMEQQLHVGIVVDSEGNETSCVL